MRVGVLIELFRDTDIDARFAELRSMGDGELPVGVLG